MTRRVYDPIDASAATDPIVSGFIIGCSRAIRWYGYGDCVRADYNGAATQPKSAGDALIVWWLGPCVRVHRLFILQADFGNRSVLAGLQADYERLLATAVRPSDRMRRPRPVQPSMRRDPTAQRAERLGDICPGLLRVRSVYLISDSAMV